MREDGVIRSRAVLVAIGIDWQDRRRILGVELAGRESAASWREFLLGLKHRGLHGVRLAISDDHPGLKRAVAEVLPEAAWQRCDRPLPAQRLDHLPRKANDDCLTELRWLYDLRDIAEARHPLRNWLAKWAGKHPKLCAWVEEQIEETWTFYRQPRGAPQTPQEHQPPRTPLARRSNTAPTSCASSRTNRAACASSAPSPPNSTRSGSTAPSTSTCNPLKDQLKPSLQLAA